MVCLNQAATANGCRRNKGRPAAGRSTTIPISQFGDLTMDGHLSPLRFSLIEMENAGGEFEPAPFARSRGPLGRDRKDSQFAIEAIAY